MVEQPLVSVIMPVYNSEQWIALSLKSVLRQTLKNIEVIIIDDHSTDFTVSIASSFQKNDSRIHLVRLNQNTGVANARNIGVENATGNYVAFLDADDLWAQEKLELQVRYMQKCTCDFSYGDYYLIDKAGKITGKRTISQDALNHQELLSGNKIGLLTVMLTREIAQKIKFPNINHEDYACWLAITDTGIVAQKYSNEFLASYRKHGTTLTSNKLRSALWTWNIFRNFEGANFFQTLVYFTRYIFMGIFDKR